MATLLTSGLLTGKSPAARESSSSAYSPLNVMTATQLPLGTSVDAISSSPYLSASHPLTISSGYRHHCILATGPTGLCALTFGLPEAGRLGVDSDQYRDYFLDPAPEELPLLFTVDIPRTVEYRRHVVMVSCGREHTVFLASDGVCFSCGWGEAGRLGVGGDCGEVGRPVMVREFLNGPVEDTPEMQPTAALPIVKIKSIACGREHSLFVSTPHGYVYSTGAGFGGRLGHMLPLKTRRNGLGTTVKDFDERDVLVPTLVGVESGATFKDAGEARTPPDFNDVFSPRTVRGVKAAAAGDLHSAAVTSAGELITWGFGDSGALGRANPDSDKSFISPEPTVVEFDASLDQGAPFVTDVAVGAYHTVCCDAEGSCYVFGDGTDGQLGLGLPYTAVLSPVRMAAFGKGTDRRVEKVSAGFCTTAVVTTEGEAYVWGCAEGQDGAEVPAAAGVPTKVEGGGVVGDIKLGGYSAVVVGRAEGGDKVKEERRRGRKWMGGVEVAGKREVKVNWKLLSGSLAAKAVGCGGCGKRRGSVGNVSGVKLS